MPSSRQRHAVEVELDAEVALGAHLDRRAGEARRAHVLDRDDAPEAISSRQASSSSFSANGSPTCTVGRFSSDGVVELGRGHGGAVDAVAAGLRAEIDDRVPDAGRLGVEDLVAPARGRPPWR